MPKLATGVERGTAPEPPRFGDSRCTPYFWSKVNVDDSGCWVWTGGANENGYGRLETAEGSDRAHRVAYTRMVAPIPEGMELDHLCRTRLCVRPDHLQPVTHRQNAKRAAAIATVAATTSTVTKSGTVAGGAKSQHVDLYRKLLLRRNLLVQAMPGAVYAPFIGDGDIAAEVYADRTVYGADLDPQRVATARSRLTGEIVIADCDGWPFPDLAEPIAVADIDSYSNPYPSFAAFWANALTTPRVVIFGTDGHRQTIQRQHKTIDLPSGTAHPTDPNTSRAWGARWWLEHVLPFLSETVAPAVVAISFHYLRGPNMLYWGIVVDREEAKSAAGVERGTADTRDREVEDALYQAALSGNVTAIDKWLSSRQPARWGGRQQSAIVPIVDLEAALGYEPDDLA